MKKFLAIIASLALVLGFAASAFAIHAEIPSETQAVVAKGTTQITLGGEIRFRGEYQSNLDLDKKGGNSENATDSASYYDGRVRLRIQADVSKNTTGVVHLETGSGTTDTYTWGGAQMEGKGVYPMGNGKRGTLDVLEAWILHKGSGLLGIPAGIKVGHMPLKLGYGLFFDHSKFGDDAIVFFMDPTKELHIGLLTAKFKEGTNPVNDDADAYVALMTYKPNKTTSIGLDITYVDDKLNWIRGDGAAQTTLDDEDKGTHLWNFGIRGETEVAGLGIKADVEIQSGESKSNTTDLAADTAGTQTKIKHSGYAYLIGLSYKLDPVKLSLDYAYGSGDNNKKDDKNKTFVTALSAIQKFTYVYDYRAAAATGSAQTGLANTQYWKLGANANLTKDLNADVNLYLLRAAKKKAVSITNGNTTKGDSKKLGTEVDAKVTYKIDRNLTYWVEGGYLWTGGFYDSTTVASDDAYAVRHGIMLSF